MSYRLRVQLQKDGSSNSIESKTDSSDSPISAYKAKSLLDDLYSASRREFNSDEWERGFKGAIDAAKSWLSNNSYGYSPRGDGDHHNERFNYKGDTYRVDIGTFGGGEGWFK